MPACTTLRGQADAACADGNYERAAALYDEALQKDSSDAIVKKLRDRAREAAIRVAVENSQSLRAAHRDDEAAEATLRALSLVHAWNITPAVKPALNGEVAASAASITARVSAATPLRAEALVKRWGRLLDNPELAATRAELVAAVSAKGRAKCEAVTTNDSRTPWAAWIVGRYCGHFGIAREPVQLPELRRGIAIAGGVRGASAAENAQMTRGLAAAFERSVWFDADAAGPAIQATIDGQLSTSIQSHRVRLTKEWVESVPYTDHEDVQEAYQEPYTDTEWVTRSVPQTEYRVQTRLATTFGDDEPLLAPLLVR